MCIFAFSCSWLAYLKDKKQGETPLFTCKKSSFKVLSQGVIWLWCFAIITVSHRGAGRQVLLLLAWLFQAVYLYAKLKQVALEADMMKGMIEEII